MSRRPGHAPPSPSPIRTLLGPRAGCPALPAPRAHTPCPRSLVPQACACRPFALHSQQLCSSPGIRSVGAWLSQTFLVVQGYPLPSSGGGCNCCLLPGHADQLPLSWQREVKPGWILTVPGGPPTGERCALAALAAMAVGRQQRCPPTELCLLAPEAGITLGHCGHPPASVSCLREWTAGPAGMKHSLHVYPPCPEEGIGLDTGCPGYRIPRCSLGRGPHWL